MIYTVGVVKDKVRDQPDQLLYCLTYLHNQIQNLSAIIVIYHELIRLFTGYTFSCYLTAVNIKPPKFTSFV